MALIVYHKQITYSGSIWPDTLNRGRYIVTPLCNTRYADWSDLDKLTEKKRTHSCSTRSRFSRFTLKDDDKQFRYMKKNSFETVNIPPVHHMTASGTLDPTMFSLMRTDVGASFPTEITQKTCRINSHLSWGIGLCTEALAAMPKDWTAAWHHFMDSVGGREAH